MNILGLNLGHDASCTLIKNNKIVAACEQERYSKKKHTRQFPIDAINDALNIGKIKINKIDLICVAFLPLRYLDEFFLRPLLTDQRKINFLLDGSDRIYENLNLEKIIREKLNYKNKIFFKSHHLCHLASAFYPSGFKKSLIFSCDGIGEIDTTLFGIGLKKNIKVLKENSKFPHSLGLIYAAFTYYLGWKPFYDEGIVMGLAPYGNPNNQVKKLKKSYIAFFRDLIKYDGGCQFYINEDWISYNYQRNTWFSEKFYKIFGKKRVNNGLISQKHKDIASALQLRLEEVVLKILNYLKKKYKLNYLCIAGGVGLNCSLNGAIYRSNLFKEIFVKPASGDAGTAYGAALLGAGKKISSINLKTPTFYLGSRFSSSQVQKALKKYKTRLNFRKSMNIYTETAELLKNGKIIGWFQGSSEFGPRALGNRSILSRPYPYSTKNHINKNVKFREYFRPFAPAVINSDAEKYFNITQKSEHMLIAFKVKKNMKIKIPATVHVDNTSRVQTVSKTSNLKFYRLLTEFKKKTDVSVLLNTSFNIKGQPIVNSPEDAIKCFLKYNLDYLIIDNFLILKK